MRDEANILFGRNTVTEALRGDTTVERIFLLDGNHDGILGTIFKEAKKQGIRVDFVKKDRLDEMCGNGKHQGVCAYVAAFEYATVDDILKKAEDKGEAPFIILLDDIVDPHNLGAIIRSANVCGAHGVIIPKNNAAGLTETAAKAAAGALSHTPVARVTSLSRTIADLKEKGIWFACADMGGEPCYKQNLTGPIGLVIGNEGKGVSPLVKKSCDFVASIPVAGEIESLNASVAAGILMYEIVRQRND